MRIPLLSRERRGGQSGAAKVKERPYNMQGRNHKQTFKLFAWLQLCQRQMCDCDFTGLVPDILRYV